MKKVITLIFLVLATYVSAQPVDGASGFKADMVEIMKNMKTYTLAIANQMPQDKYDFRPVDNDTVRTFAEQLKHLNISMRGITNNVLSGKTFDPSEVGKIQREYLARKMSKAEIMTEMTQEFDHLISKLSAMPDQQFDEQYQLPFPGSKPKSYRVMAMFARDHISHHRAQAVVYLRMNGIEPVFYFPF